MGLPKFLRASLPACHGLMTPADLIILAISDDVVLPSGPLKPSASATTPLSKLYQHFRERGSPYGLQDSLSTLHLSCSPQPSRLRHRSKTRYGWVANPFPTGTFTLQDAPSFAWRDNGSGDHRAVFWTGASSWLCAAFEVEILASGLIFQILSSSPAQPPKPFFASNTPTTSRFSPTPPGFWSLP